MELSQLIDSNNRQLFQQVSAQIKIELRENPDWRAEIWKSQLENNKAVILFTQVIDQHAAFTHELLHIRLLLNGYKNILHGLSIHPTTQLYLLPLIKSIENTFQHLKIFGNYEDLGYSKAVIYDLSDDMTCNLIKGELADSTRTLTSLLPMYMSIMDPFNSIPSEDKKALQSAFKAYNDRKHEFIFRKVDDLLLRWKKDIKNDSTSYWQELLQMIGISDAWLSFSPDCHEFYAKHFPDDGFFIDTPFTVKDIHSSFSDEPSN